MRNKKIYAFALVVTLGLAPTFAMAAPCSSEESALKTCRLKYTYDELAKNHPCQTEWANLHTCRTSQDPISDRKVTE